MSPFTGFGTVYSGGNGTQSLDSDLQRLSEVLCGGRHGGLNAKVAKLELETALYNSLQIYKDCSPSRSQSERQQAAALVKAAHTADKAGQAALKAGQNFLDTANKAPATIVDTVDKINGAINSALIATEPDVLSLASNLKGVIPDSATGLAGIKSTAAATTTTTTAAAQEVGISEALPPPTVSQPAPLTETTASLRDLIDDVNSSVAQVAQIIESATKPVDNSKCVALTNLAKATVISLNPEGDIPLGAGDKTTVTIKGATAPRVWPLFAQAEKLKSVVTADIQDGSTLEISAAPDTAAGSYPFIVTDGTAEMPFKVFVKSADAEPTAMTDADCKKQQKQQARTRHRHGAASATGQ